MLLPLLVIAVLIGASWFTWPRDQRSLNLTLCTAGFLCGAFVLAIYITKWWPVKHHVIENRTVITRYKSPPKVIYKDRIVYKAPDGEVASVDVEAACKGKMPIQIVKITESNTDANDDKAGKTTWVLAHPLGSKVNIVCGRPGSYSDFWSVGDVIQIVGGQAQ